MGKVFGSRTAGRDGTAPSPSNATISDREGAADPGSSAISAGSTPDKPACDRFLDRIDCADWEVMTAALEAMPVEARGDLVASMALLAPPARSLGSIPASPLQRLLYGCLSHELPLRPDVVESITAIMAEPSNSHSAHFRSEPYLTYLRAAKAAGINFTMQQRAD